MPTHCWPVFSTIGLGRMLLSVSRDRNETIDPVSIKEEDLNCQNDKKRGAD